MTEDPDVLEHDLSDLMRAEQEKEITQITLMQGQIMALIATLHKNGILTQTDLSEMDVLADQMQHHLSILFKANDMQQLVNAGEPIDETELTQINQEAAKSALFIATHLPPSAEKLEELQRLGELNDDS